MFNSIKRNKKQIGIVIGSVNNTANPSDEQAYIKWLKEENGYIVREYRNIFDGNDFSPEMKADLETNDCIIISRRNHSLDFLEGNGWNELTVPVLAHNAFIARSAKLNWFDQSASPSLKNQNYISKINQNLFGASDDVFFTGVKEDPAGSGKYPTHNSGEQIHGYDPAGNVGNAVVYSTFNENDTAADVDNAIISTCFWFEDKPFYSGAMIPSSLRGFMVMGPKGNDTKERNAFSLLNDNGRRLLKNIVKYFAYYEDLKKGLI